MAQPPNRPFESLDWYRDAARHGFAEDRGRNDRLRRLTGAGPLRAHISLFAITSVLLVAVNLLRTPDDVWADRWIMAWVALILIHGVCIGIAWAIRQWTADDADDPVQIGGADWEQTAMFGWGAANGQASPEPQEATYRVAASTPPPGPVAASPWANWNARPQTPPPPESERASWSEASPAAWIERRARTARSDKPDAGPAPDA